MKYLIGSLCIFSFLVGFYSEEVSARQSEENKKNRGRSIASISDISGNEHKIATNGTTGVLLDRPGIIPSAQSFGKEKNSSTRLEFEKKQKSVPRQGVLSPQFRYTEISVKYQ